MKYLWLLILLMVNCQLLSAQRTNPFEIKDRLDSLYQQNSSSNPFEIGSSIQQVQDSVMPSESELGTPVIPSDQTPAISNTSTDNPFEVDHVPIRRSQLKEESALKKAPPPLTPDIKTTENAHNSPGGLLAFIVSVIGLFLVAIVANTKRSLFGKLFKSFTNDNFLKLTQREENGGLNGGFLLLYVLYFINMATFLYLIVIHFKGVKVWWWWFLIGVIIVYIARHLFMFALSLIFPLDRPANQYNFTIAVFNLIIGVVLIPLNLIIAYAYNSLSVATIYFSLAILGFIFLVRYAKGFLIGMMGASRSIFHFLLYLCTFEIVPILLMIKFIKNI